MTPLNVKHLKSLIRTAVSICGDKDGHFTLQSFQATLQAEFDLPEDQPPLWRCRQILHDHSWIRHVGDGWGYWVA